MKDDDFLAGNPFRFSLTTVSLNKPLLTFDVNWIWIYTTNHTQLQCLSRLPCKLNCSKHWFAEECLKKKKKAFFHYPTADCASRAPRGSGTLWIPLNAWQEKQKSSREWPCGHLQRLSPGGLPRADKAHQGKG